MLEKIITDKATLLSGFYMYVSFSDFDMIVKIGTGLLTITYLLIKIINEKNKMNKNE